MVSWVRWNVKWCWCCDGCLKVSGQHQGSQLCGGSSRNQGIRRGEGHPDHQPDTGSSHKVGAGDGCACMLDLCFIGEI